MIPSLFSNILLLLLLLHSSSSYQFESCCSNENSTRLLSCPLNFVIKLRSANFYTGHGCAISTCQKRFNKHYLPCNDHRTCSISIECILMDLSGCPWMNEMNNYSQYLIVEYDCIVNQPEIPLLDQKKQKKKENIVLFSAKVNIESPPEIFNETSFLEEENDWRDYFLKKYFPDQTIENEKNILISPSRSLFSDILRTVIILIIFASILIIFMIISLVIYKRIRLNQKRKFYEQEKHQPFPGDDAYDNLKGTNMETASDSGTTTDV